MPFYFGYASNMSRHYLENVRGVFPMRSRLTKLHAYKLVMNLKAPNIIVPRFANISYQIGSQVEGILHEVSQNELDK